MQSTHPPLHLRSIDTLNTMALLVLDKDARKKAYQVCAVQEHIRFIQGHALIDAASQMFHPHTVLPTHVFLLSSFLLLASHEQALCAALVQFETGPD